MSIASALRPLALRVSPMAAKSLARFAMTIAVFGWPSGYTARNPSSAA
jgi:hypothetical protein